MDWPSELAPYAEALAVVAARPHADRGWLAPAFPAAPPEPLRPGAPPYDGIYRGSWLSPGVCLRFDLDHPAVPSAVAARLRAADPGRVGADGAWYAFGVDARSQRTNRLAVVEALWLRVADPS